MVAMIDLTGQRFGRLTVVERAGSIGKRAAWRCRCDCGGEKVARSIVLRNGETQSCGCYARERIVATQTRHGHARTGKVSRTWRSWSAMRARCGDPTHVHYALYGGRGIVVCDRWASFDNFLADMGERPEGKTLDRIEPDGNYEPGNCRWATPVEQQRNRRDRRRC